jgi:hypothetical protein
MQKAMVIGSNATTVRLRRLFFDVRLRLLMGPSAGTRHPWRFSMRLVALLPLVAYGLSEACSCMPLLPVTERKELFAKTVHVEILGNELDSVKQAWIMTVQVIKDYSPDAGNARDTLAFWSGYHSCGVGYPAGEEMILFGDTTLTTIRGEAMLPADIYGTHLCMGNIGGEALEGALDSLEAASTIRDRGTPMRSVGFPVRERMGSGILFLRQYGVDGRALDAWGDGAFPRRRP